MFRKLHLTTIVRILNGSTSPFISIDFNGIHLNKWIFFTENNLVGIYRYTDLHQNLN